MREARMILVKNWDGFTTAAANARHRLIREFGGVTEIVCVGHWQNPTTGAIEVEPVAVYDIAYEITRENDEKLYEIAQEYRKAAKQKEVYLRYGSGMVQMVSETSTFMDDGLWEGITDTADA